MKGTTMQQHEGSGYAVTDEGSGYARHLSKYLLAVLTVAALAYCSPHPAPAKSFIINDALASDLSYGCLEGSTNTACITKLNKK